MLPKAHIIYGAILALASYLLFSNITLVPALLLFFSSFLIDVDHYLWYGFVRKDWSLKNAYNYLKKEEPINPLMLFHTIEFLIFVGLLSFVWFGFYYVLIGMLFHSALDISSMIKPRTVFNREYSLIYHLTKRKIYKLEFLPDLMR